MEGCEYKAKTEGNLKKHKFAVHDIDVTYYLCNVDGCEYKAKVPGTLKKHKAMIHDIDVTYCLCNADGCEYKAKESVSLKKSMERENRSERSSGILNQREIFSFFPLYITITNTKYRIKVKEEITCI